MTSLTSVDLFANAFSGALPLQALAQMAQLQQLRFENNPELSGHVTHAFLRALNLRRWDVRMDPKISRGAGVPEMIVAADWDPQGTRR